MLSVVYHKRIIQKPLCQALDSGIFSKKNQEINMKKKLLLFYWYHKKKSPQTVLEHIDNLQQHSQYQIERINTYNKWRLPFRPRIDLSQYDGIIIHNTQSYSISNVLALNKTYSIDIGAFQGIKILMKQDEMLRTNETIALLQDWGFHLLLTCVPPPSIPLVYSPALLPRLKTLSVQTGYVTDEMTHYRYSQADDRSMDIVYRGMKLPYQFGTLAYDKFKIGEQFKRICQDNQLLYDISSDMHDRIYGKQWIAFLANSKATLGVESGASIMDFTGEVEAETVAFLRAHPRAVFDEVYAQVLYRYDNKLLYNAISPRHFEAAAVKTVQILYEGEYGGIFQPNRHYIPLKRDLSNLDSVLEKFHDKAFRYALTACAYDEIILNERYQYRTFVNEFDAAVAAL